MIKHLIMSRLRFHQCKMDARQFKFGQLKFRQLKFLKKMFKRIYLKKF